MGQPTMLKRVHFCQIDLGFLEPVLFGNALDNLDYVNLNETGFTDNQEMAVVNNCIQNVAHSFKCRDRSCQLSEGAGMRNDIDIEKRNIATENIRYCQSMKKLLTHFKHCTKRTEPCYPKCKRHRDLAIYHVAHCEKDACKVPVCSFLKGKSPVH